MSFDFNAPDASQFNAGRESPFGVRRRLTPQVVNRFSIGFVTYVGVNSADVISQVEDPQIIFHDGTTSVTAPQTIDETWRRVVAWSDGDAVNLRIDNAAAIRTPAGPVGNLGTLWGNQTHQEFVELDDLGIWDRAWTNPNFTYDWNAGAGRTFPEAAHIPGLVAYYRAEEIFSEPFPNLEGGQILDDVGGGYLLGTAPIVGGKLGNAVKCGIGNIFRNFGPSPSGSFTIRFWIRMSQPFVHAPIAPIFWLGTNHLFTSYA